MTASSYFWIRSAGFPFSWLETLSILADSPLLATYEEEQMRLLRINENLRAAIETHIPQSLAKYKRKFDEHISISVEELPISLRKNSLELLIERTQILARLKNIKQNLTVLFEEETKKARKIFIAYLKDEMTREAIFLSNPDALQRIESLIQCDCFDRLDSRSRQRLRLAWNYLQRLCAKNDTVSFFGPIAWGNFASEHESEIQIKRKKVPWLAARKTFFEHWVIYRIAETINADVELIPYLPLLPNPGCTYEKGNLHIPLDKTVRVNALSATLLERIFTAIPDGILRATLIAECTSKNYSATEINLALNYFLAKKVIFTGYRLSPNCSNPIQILINHLQLLPVSLVRRQFWIDALIQLDRLRHAFSQAHLSERMMLLDKIKTFLIQKNIDISRNKGRMYVGRLPIYEDCARNLEITLGGLIVKTIRTELQTVMKLYCWLARAVAIRIHDCYMSIWQTCQSDKNVKKSEVNFLKFFAQLNKINIVDQVVVSLTENIREAWQRIIANYDKTDEIFLTVHDIEKLLLLLTAIEPRVKNARALGIDIHSPDFMVAASHADAIKQGQFELIIGEVHPAVHTVSQPVAQPFCPYAKNIKKEVEQLLAPHTLILADSSESYQRSHIDWLAVPQLMRIILPENNTHVSATHTCLSGDGEVLQKNDWLYYHDRKTGIQQDLLTAVPSDFHRACFALAGEMLAQHESRRLRYGRLLIKRRTWQFTADKLPHAPQVTEKLESYLIWRHWIKSNKLPQHVFVKFASEPKPIYVDFYNPIAIDLLASLAKNGETMRFSEMRPTPEELWFTDSTGKFCCEFRTSLTT